MARSKWLAGWKLFREEDPTTPTPTQYQSSGASSGGVATPDFSPTSYEGHFQSPIVLPTPQSEQRQTDQEIQGSTIEGTEIWSPRTTPGATRLQIAPQTWEEIGIQNTIGTVRLSAFRSEEIYTRQDYQDAGTKNPMGFLAFIESYGSPYNENASTWRIHSSYDASVPTGRIRGDATDFTYAEVHLNSGEDHDVFSGGTSPSVQFYFSHQDDADAVLTGSTTWRLIDVGGGVAEIIQIGDPIDIQTLKYRGVKAQRTAAQTYTTNTTVALSCTAADIYDSNSLHDPAVNATRITAGRAGLWHIGGDAQWSGNPVNGVIYVYKNGVQIGKGHQIVGDYRQMHIAIDDVATAGSDYYELFLFQNSGGNLTATGSFWAHWVGV